MQNPELSCIIPTVEKSGREERLGLLIDALAAQTGIALEIIVVWQGIGDPPVALIGDPRIRLIMMRQFSSSRSRNVGADFSHGRFLAFLDDDVLPVGESHCANVLARIDRDKLDFLTCNIQSSGKIWAAEPVRHDVEISRGTLIANLWEPGLTIRRDAFEAVRFDERLGIGCVHGSSEGFDLGARLLAAGYKGKRIVDLLIDHPPLPEPGGDFHRERTFFYSLGNGRTLVQHRFWLSFFVQLAKAFIKMIWSLVTRPSHAPRWALRILSLAAGPLVPPGPPRIMPGRQIYAAPEEVRADRSAQETNIALSAPQVEKLRD